MHPDDPRRRRLEEEAERLRATAAAFEQQARRGFSVSGGERAPAETQTIGTDVSHAGVQMSVPVTSSGVQKGLPVVNQGAQTWVDSRTDDLNILHGLQTYDSRLGFPATNYGFLRIF